MKKSAYFAALSLCAVTALSVCGCGEQPSAPQTDSRVYNNVADFSSRQGYLGWHYLYRDSMGEIYKMTFDYGTGRWNGRDFYCYNSPVEQHPGNNVETLIGWQATVEGRVQVTGSVTRNPADWSGDGVFYYVTLNDGEEDYLFSALIGAEVPDPYAVSFEAQVKAGDMLYFCINGNGNNSYDITVSDITVKYL